MPKFRAVVQDRSGTVVTGGTVTVFQAGTGDLATIYSDRTLATVVPGSVLTTDGDGHFEFYAPGGEYRYTFAKDGVQSEEDFVLLPSSPAFFNAKDYGITATASAASNDAALAALMTAFGAAGGGALFLSEIIPVATTISVPSNVSIFAHSWGGGFDMETADTQILLLQGVEKVRIQGLHLSGTGGFVTPGIGAIRVGLGSMGNGADDCIVQGCLIENADSCGITVGSESNRCLVDGNVIDGAGEEGIYVLGSDCIVRGNISRNSGESGIKCRGARAIVEGNQSLANGQYGILVTDVTGVLVSGNYCYLNGLDGIRVAGTTADVSVSNNHAVANGQGADDTHSNIRVTGTAITGVSITGNTARHGGGATQPQYGVRIGSTATGTLVGFNDLRDGGKTGQILDNGTGTQTPYLKAQEVAASANTSITADTSTDITGATMTVTPVLNQRVVVHATVSVNRVTAGATLSVSLLVNGSAQPGSIVTVDSARQMQSGSWVVSLTGGTAYTIKLAGANNTTGGEYTIFSTHTRLSLVPAGQ